MEWMPVIVLVVIIAIFIMWLYMREQFAGVSKEMAGDGRFAIATVHIPAHNSGKATMWLPNGLQPQYYWRNLAWIQ